MAEQPSTEHNNSKRAYPNVKREDTQLAQGPVGQDRVVYAYAVPFEPEAAKAEKKVIPAACFLEKGVQAMQERGQLRDSPHGERSMLRTVNTFNALTNRDLTVAEGWQFMILLKMVRGNQGQFHEDDYVDMASYSALLGEEESQSR